MLSRRDYLALGNTVIETLMRPRQDKIPDARCKLLDDFMPHAVRQCCQIPADLTYPRPFSDECICFEDRDTWEKDRFPELVIHAYIVGARIWQLPLPHGKQVAFFHYMAAKQREAMLAAYVAWLEANPVPIPSLATCKCEECRTWKRNTTCTCLECATWRAKQKCVCPQCKPKCRYQSGLNAAYPVWERTLEAARGRLLRAKQGTGQAAEGYVHESKRNREEREADMRAEQEFRQWKEEQEQKREAEERARAEAGVGDSELARQIRDILASGMDASVIKEEMEFLIRNHKTGGAR